MRRLWLLAALFVAGCSRPQAQVVLYCGQDEEFATEILDDFTRETGVSVAVRSDTEANKSVSLYENIVREARHPRCDVFWNNEILNTIRLRQQGLLEAYTSPAAVPFPVEARAADATWHAFAARARILLVNQRVAEKDHPRSIFDLTDGRWRGKVAVAKPQFGTTASHFACLYQALGKERATEFFRGLRANATLLPGNKDVALAVAEGRFDVGMTDTDDAIAEIQHGRAVAIIYPDQQPDGIGMLFLPNTVAVVRSGPNPAMARRLVDYLLSPSVESKLALGKSGQIPLNPQVTAKPPVETPRTIRPMSVDFEKAAALWDEVQTVLRDQFVQP